MDNAPIELYASSISAMDNGYSINGPLFISGVVKKIGVSIPCRVRLYEKFTGAKLREVATDQNGNYRFDGLSENKYFIVAHDPATQYNAVIQDNVVPK